MVLTSSMTVGSKSTNTALGTCLPEDVSEKKALKESSAIPIESSSGMVPVYKVIYSYTNSSYINFVTIWMNTMLQTVQLPEHNYLAMISK